MDDRDQPLRDLFEYPLMKSLFGRRSRRFGRGMNIPSGPLAYESRHEPMPLSRLEESVLVAAATGVSGWSFGVPFGPLQPDSHADFTGRFAGRTYPTAAGIGTPALFYTDDQGCYFTNNRDIAPTRMRELRRIDDDAERIIAATNEVTKRVRDQRLDLPPTPPHVLPPNMWMANAEGSTLFMPVGDASEQFFGLLTLALRHGAMIVDEETGRSAGNLGPFLRSGLIDEEKVVTLGEFQRDTYETNCMELAMMGHNTMLTMQAMGLGGLFLAGINRWSVMGAYPDEGIEGLGFRFVEDHQGNLDPVGLDGIYEGLCPPYFDDMYEAARAFADRRHGPGGAYDPNTPGPWKDSAAVKETVEPFSDEFVDCLGEVAQYIYEKYGKFPGTTTTIVMPCYVQAVHIDTDFYDEHYDEGAYLSTHAEHMERWH